MGMNYYLKDKWESNTPWMLEEGAYLHIGKSSGGWAFALHVFTLETVNGTLTLKSLDAWVRYIQTVQGESPGRFVIVNEGGFELTLGELLKVIKGRTFKGSPVLHAPIDGLHCVGQGECGGTWDYIQGDFS